MITRNPQVDDPNHTADHVVINEFILDHSLCVIVQPGLDQAVPARPSPTNWPGGRVMWLLFNAPGTPNGTDDVEAYDIVFNISGTEWS